MLPLLNRFRAAPPCLLLESGAIEEGENYRNALARGVMLSRALCRFKLFRGTPGLTRSQLARAARTFAEAHAPFEATGSLILRTPAGAAIWYWDKAQLAVLGAGEARVVSPESVWRAPGEGWRVLACAEGFEAQYWEDGGLIASSWRREMLTRAQWAAFALNVDATQQAPDAPPTPQVLPRDDRSWRRAEIRTPLSWRELERGAISIALCASALATFFTAQALNHEGAARADRRALDALEERVAEDAQLARVRERLTLMAEYDAATRTPRALAAAADAFEVLSRFDVTPQAWAVVDETFRLEIEASGTPVRDIVAALEAAPGLCGVTPELANAAGGIELRAAIVASAEVECEPALRGRAS